MALRPDHPFRETQQSSWDGSAAGFLKWLPTLEGPTAAVSERLLVLACVEPGQRVLDVATGLGEPALTAARRVGPSGSVTATDLSAEMLALARERAAFWEAFETAVRQNVAADGRPRFTNTAVLVAGQRP